MFYDRFVMLCESRGVSPSRAAIDAGLSKSTVTKWKRFPDAQPTGNVIDELLGEEGPEPQKVSDSDLKFALFGGSGDITDEMYNEVLSFAAFVKEREAAKKRKE